MNFCILTIFRCHYQCSKNGPKLMIDSAHQLSDKSLGLVSNSLDLITPSWNLIKLQLYNCYVSRELHPSCPLCPREQVLVDRALKRHIMRHNSFPAHTRALSSISHKSKFGKATYHKGHSIVHPETVIRRWIIKRHGWLGPPALTRACNSYHLLLIMICKDVKRITASAFLLIRRIM